MFFFSHCRFPLDSTFSHLWLQLSFSLVSLFSYGPPGKKKVGRSSIENRKEKLRREEAEEEENMNIKIR